MKRSDFINKLIDDDMRSAGNRSGRSLSGCSVCWTCKCFMFEEGYCKKGLDIKEVDRFPPGFYGSREYMENKVHMIGDKGSPMFRVNKPEWYRCSYWTGGE